MKEILQTFYDYTVQFFGDGVYLVLAVIAGVFLMFTDKKKYGKIIWPSLLILFVIYNPWVYKYILDRSRFWRMFWTIPFVLIAGLGFMELLKSCNGTFKKLFITFAMLLVIYLCGSNVFEGVGQGKNTNAYRLTQETIEVADVMLKYDDSPKCIIPRSLYTAIRQYSGEIHPMFGRNMDGYMYDAGELEQKIFEEMLEDEPDYGYILYHARRLRYDFVVVDSSKPIYGELAEEYGYSLLEDQRDYMIYFNESLKGEDNSGYTWERDKFGWKLKNPDGEIVKQKVEEVSGVWYYLNKNGYLMDYVDSETAKNLKPDDLIIIPIYGEGEEAGDKDDSELVSYLVDDQKGHFILVDGGRAEDFTKPLRFIRLYGNVVDGWILNYPHPDRTGAFNEIYGGRVEGNERFTCIEIKQLYAVETDWDYVHKNIKNSDYIECYDRFHDISSTIDNITWAKKGDVVEVEGIKFKLNENAVYEIVSE